MGEVVTSVVDGQAPHLVFLDIEDTPALGAAGGLQTRTRRAMLGGGDPRSRQRLSAGGASDSAGDRSPTTSTRGAIQRNFKWRALSALGNELLLEVGRGLELDVTTRMAVDELRDALAKSKRATLDAIVQESLPGDTLKELCALGLDDTGKEKATLVERILAGGRGKHATGSDYKVDPAATKGTRRVPR